MFVYSGKGDIWNMKKIVIRYIIEC